MFALDHAQPRMSSEDIGIGRSSYQGEFSRRAMVAPVYGHTRWQCNNLISPRQYDMEDGGLGDLGFLKKLRKIAKKPLDIKHKALMKITPKPLRKKLDKTYNKTMGKIDKTLDKLDETVMPIVVPIAGAVLAPFTGGASLAAAAAISYGLARDAKKTEKKEAKEEEKEQRAAAQAEYAADEAEYLRAQKEYEDDLKQSSTIGQSGRDLWSAVPQQMDSRQLSLYQQTMANKGQEGVFIPPATFRNSVTNVPSSGNAFFPAQVRGELTPIATDDDKTGLAIGAVVIGGLMLLA